MYQYILLLAIPGKSKRSNNGIYTSNDFYEIDLRQALPSTFLRPHAQHGWVNRKRSHTATRPADYDMATSVVGIIKIRIDRAKQWISDILRNDFNGILEEYGLIIPKNHFNLTTIKIHNKTVSFFQTGIADVLDLCKSEKARPALLKLVNKFKYSDPVSSPKTEESEAMIRNAIDDLRNAIQALGDNDLLQKIETIDNLLSSRNRICERSKK